MLQDLSATSKTRQNKTITIKRFQVTHCQTGRQDSAVTFNVNSFNRTTSGKIRFKSPNVAFLAEIKRNSITCIVIITHPP